VQLEDHVVTYFDHAHILFDDQELALGGTIAVRTLVRKNGRLVSGFCEPRW